MNSPVTYPMTELLITRTFRAPREVVWQAWTDPRHLLQWTGLPQYPPRHVEGDLRIGGAWRTCLVGENGEDMCHGGVYREIIEPERLVFTFAWDGEDGKPGNEMLVTITFAEDGANTLVTLRQIGFRSVEQRDRHREGWTGAGDRLDQFLA